MEFIEEKKETLENNTEVTIKLYRLGNGVLATVETHKQDAVSSFETKHFGESKQCPTYEQNIRRARKHYNFPNIPKKKKKKKEKTSTSVKKLLKAKKNLHG